MSKERGGRRTAFQISKRYDKLTYPFDAGVFRFNGGPGGLSIGEISRMVLF